MRPSFPYIPVAGFFGLLAALVLAEAAPAKGRVALCGDHITLKAPQDIVAMTSVELWIEFGDAGKTPPAFHCTIDR